MRKIFVVPLLAAAVAVGTAPAASADPVGSGTASAFGATVAITDQEVIPPTPVAEVTAPPFGDDVDETAIPIDADPLAINGTLIARGAVHQQSDLDTALEQEPAQQEVEGPYNAQAVGQIEDLEVLPSAVAEGVPLIEADLVRGEAVAVCRAGAVQYSASSEVVNLGLGGEDPLSGPINDIITQLEEALEPLAPLVNVELNVVDVTADGASVDALVITLLEAAGETPLATVRLGHAEVSGVTCGSGDIPECSDTEDNDGDGVIDAEDPGCHSDGDPENPDSYDPNDDSEGDAPECSDTEDNDGDGVIDAEDPGCHSDGDAGNPGSYDPNDDSEADPTVGDSGGAPLPGDGGSGGGTLPNTGGTAATGVAAALGAAALGLLAVRRRLSLG